MYSSLSLNLPRKPHMGDDGALSTVRGLRVNSDLQKVFLASAMETMLLVLSSQKTRSILSPQLNDSTSDFGTDDKRSTSAPA